MLAAGRHIGFAVSRFGAVKRPRRKSNKRFAHAVSNDQSINVDSAHCAWATLTPP
jgi:hypothetical protein